jgi:hypothetical protein
MQDDFDVCAQDYFDAAHTNIHYWLGPLQLLPPMALKLVLAGCAQPQSLLLAAGPFAAAAPAKYH